MLKHIMFDLDGTLLALGFDDFLKVYVQALTAKMTALGYNGTQSVKALWASVSAMVNNDGSQTNRQVFWNTFANFHVGDVTQIEAQLDGFYTKEFCEVRDVLREERNLRAMIDGLKAKGYTLSLATNPLFPPVGVEERLKWIGLAPDDFAVVTTYENSRYCKPNLGYFTDVMNTAGFAPSETLMVGNDILDDMPAGDLGVQLFLVTDVLEHGEGNCVDDFPHGTFEELQGYFDRLPKIK